MANKSSFLGGDQSAAKVRRDFIEKPLASAKLSLLGSGMNLLNLMSVLPDAFIASQRRELERVKESGSDNDSRIAALEASIEQASALRTTVQRGEARVQRALGSIGDPDKAFHGFVSNSDLEPVSGLTVRLSGRAAASSKRGLTATTDADGYFRIPLGSKGGSGKEWKENLGNVSFSQRLNSVFAQRPATTGSGANDSSTEAKNLAQVEILQKNQVVYTDQVGVPTDEGSVYREYVVKVDKSRPESNYDDTKEDIMSDDFNVAQTSAPRKATKKKSGAAKPKRSSKK